MCNRYVSPETGDIERYWQFRPGKTWPMAPVFPRAQGPFIRSTPDRGDRELVIGQWGLIPWFAKMPKLTYSTNGARSEELGSKATFKHPWSQGKRCIILAVSVLRAAHMNGPWLRGNTASSARSCQGAAGHWRWMSPASGET